MTAQQLQQIRGTAGMTYRQMAGLLGISSPANYIRLERGRRPITKQLQAAARMIEWMHGAGQLTLYCQHVARRI